MLNSDLDNVEMIPPSPTCAGSEINFVTISTESKRRGNVTFSLEENYTIEKAFSSLIEISRIPKLETIRNVMQNNPDVNSLVNRRGINEKQIKGCLTNIVNKLLIKNKN